MKKIIPLLFLVSSLAFSQQYEFVSQEAVKIDKWKYIDLYNKTPKPEIDYRLESGKPFTPTYFDSINKTKDAHKLQTVYFSDTLMNKITIVLRTRTEEEIKKANQEFFELQKTEKKNRQKIVGTTISNLELTDIKGKKHTSESLLGKMVFLNFWFTKCAPCIQEMPDLNELKEKYGEENVAYFAITYDKADLVQQFLAKRQLDFTVIPNQQQTIDRFDVNFFPTNMLLDETGKVLFVSEIFNPKSNNGLKEIEKLLKKHKKK